MHAMRLYAINPSKPFDSRDRCEYRDTGLAFMQVSTRPLVRNDEALHEGASYWSYSVI